MENQNETGQLPDSISIVWQVDDVECRARELDIELSLDEQRQILQRIDQQHNAEVGVNWDVIDTHIQEFDRERSADTVDPQRS